MRASFSFAAALGCAFGTMAGTETNQPPTPQSIPFDSDEPTALAVNKLLSNPTIWSAVVTQFTNSGWNSSHSNAVLSLLNDLHLRLKVFHTDGGSDSAVFGLEYDYNKSLRNQTLNPGSVNPLGLSLNMFAKGTIADSAGKNPDNFLESGFKMHLFQAVGGMTPQMITNQSELAIRDEARQKAAEITRDDYWNDPAWIESGKIVMKYCRPQFCYDAAVHGTLESDQKFSNKQWAYGGQLSLVYQDWNDDSPFNWFNVMDIPFAAIRKFTMDHERFQPSGQAFPVLIGGIDLVDPSANSARLAVDPNQDAYPRLRVEVGFKTQVTRLFHTDIWLSASYRYFKEVNASALTKAAQIDEFSSFAARLDLPKGFHISYSLGKLPLDRKKDQVYTIGWAVNF